MGVSDEELKYKAIPAEREFKWQQLCNVFAPAAFKTRVV